MKLFIGCSSKNEIPDIYKEDCKIYLDGLLKNGNDLVFGAYNEGLMGLSYEIATKNNNQVIGICPETYKHDLENLKCTKEILTKTVSQRTDDLINESDALIFLPGGIGTIYELFTALESKRCHEFDKPIIIYNSCGFFDKLLEFMEKVYKEKFTPEYIKDSYHISNSKEDTIEYLKNHHYTKKLIQ